MRNFTRFTLKLTLGLTVSILLALGFSQWQPAKAAKNEVDCNAPTVVCKSGSLTGDETWTSDKIYVITNHLTVGPGATLTIEAGTIVKSVFTYFDKRSLFIDGTLNVNGTNGHPVYFTSANDDIGGDTNNDGGNSQPRADDWGNLVFRSGSHGSVNYAEVRFGDGGRSGAIRLESSSPTLDHVTIKHSLWAAISALPTDAPTITNFATEDVALAGLEIRAGTLNTNVTWNQTGIVYILDNHLTVGPGATLTIEAGTIIKFVFTYFDKRSLLVDGTLQVAGSADHPVYFTSINDDIGGDTNSNNGNTQPHADDWGNIVFRNGSHGTLHYAEVRFGDGGRGGAIRLEGSSPTLDHVTVKYTLWAAISALPTDAPMITNFAAQDVALAGMEIRAGTLTTNVTWDQTGIVYILPNHLTIGPGATLTIEAGNTVKFAFTYFDKRSLLVDGALQVNGSAEHPVYFTSLFDDIGGDTNNDSGNAQPHAGDWGGIRFNANSQGNFTHAVIRYAGVSQTYGALHIKDAVVTMVDSVLSNNFIGLFAEGASAEVQAQILNVAANVSKSGLYNNTEYDVFAKAGASVVANNNWWGSSNAQPKVSGTVAVENRCADETCTVVSTPSHIYLPLVRR